MSEPKKLDGLRVVTFESRRAKEINELIRRQGGTPISAPALREVPNSENKEALEFVQRLENSELDMVIFLTGVGTRYLVEAIALKISKESFAQALGSVITVARGPKPVAALRELGVTPTITVPEPNTWKEVVTEIDKKIKIQDKTVAVQEYGEENPEFLAALKLRGAKVIRVPIYRWALPENLDPLHEAIRLILKGQVDIVVFTSATQVAHLFQVAGAEKTQLLKDALKHVVVASIGPICSDALKRYGLAVDLEPAHPKMGSFILDLADRGPSFLKTKRV